jgi:Tfp pilus assembly protein PilO
MTSSTLKPHYVHAAGVAILLAVVLATYGFVVRPAFHRRAEVTTLRTQLQNTQSQIRELESQRSTMRHQLARSREELSNHALNLESANALNARVARMTDLVESCGLVIQRTDIGAVRERNWYQIVPISMTGTGSYRTCASFMRRLRETMPDTGMTAFALSAKTRSGDDETAFVFDFLWHAAPSLTAGAE